MSTTLIPKPTHGSLEWLLVRHRDTDGRCIVGASEVSTIMGANPYENIGDLAVRKLLPPEVIEPNEAMRRGNVLEPALIQFASEELGEELHTPDVMFLNDRLISTLDARGVNTTDLIVEAKTNNYWSHGQQLPDSWFWQAQAQMHCTETELVHFVVLDRAMRLGMTTVARHNKMIEAMTRNVEAFCEAIDGNRLPDDVELTAPQVSALFPKAEGETELDSSALSLITEWGAIKDAIKDLENKEKAVKDALANMLRDSEFGTVDGQRVISYKTQTTKRFDTKAFAEAHPELQAKFTTQSAYRVLRTVK